MKNITEVLKALSDETRLRIISLLKEGEEFCVCHIMDILEITQTKASRHLKRLRNAGLVKDRQQAQWVHYSLTFKNDSLIDEIVKRARNTEPFQSDLARLEERGSEYAAMNGMCPFSDVGNNVRTDDSIRQ